MAASLKRLDQTTRYAEFFIDSEADLEKLPTKTQSGKDSLSSVNPVSQGSTAFLTNSDSFFYRLSGGNVWNKITASGSAVTYSSLPDKPSINGTTLVGELYSADISVPEKSYVQDGTLVIS